MSDEAKTNVRFYCQLSEPNGADGTAKDVRAAQYEPHSINAFQKFQIIAQNLYESLYKWK